MEEFFIGRNGWHILVIEDSEKNVVFNIPEGINGWKISADCLSQTLAKSSLVNIFSQAKGAVLLHKITVEQEKIKTKRHSDGSLDSYV